MKKDYKAGKELVIVSPIVTLFLFGLIIVDKFHVIIQLATQHAVVLSFGLH